MGILYLQPVFHFKDSTFGLFWEEETSKSPPNSFLI